MTRILTIALCLGLSVEATACNIPVFRYALERWKPDSYEIVVFYRELTAEQEQYVHELEAASSENQGSVNAVVVRSKLVDDASPTNAELWKEVSRSLEVKLPYVVLRAQAGQAGTILPWHGSLDEARQLNLLDSPVRRELVRRLQSSHSIVWLLLRSNDAARTEEIRELLKSECERLATTIKLPDGIGLPGSELHSEMPLLIKFSYLEIDPDDRQEAFLVRLLKEIHPDAVAGDQPLIVPVFGRGRALEVIPASHTNPSLMEDLTLFLGGACSCQVKERNPGFDLLLSSDWDRELFGERGLRPPPAKTIADRDRAPVLLTVPPGRKK